MPEAAADLPLHLIFGGTFDPVHNGHLAVARAVREQLGPEDFRFLPAGDPPHRAGTFAAPAHRLEMLRLALAEEPDLAIDEQEMRRSGPSYMSLTLTALRKAFPADSLALLLGQDAANGLDQWHEWQSLLTLAHLVIMSRPGQEAAYSPVLEEHLRGREVDTPQALRRATAGKVLYLAVPPLSVSSTELRERLEAPGGQDLPVPGPVARYIEAQGLYR